LHSSAAIKQEEQLAATAVAILETLPALPAYPDQTVSLRRRRICDPLVAFNVPSNSLAALDGIGLDCAERQIRGSDVAIDIEAIDETNTRIDVSALLTHFRRHGAFGLVPLVGMQSNQ
jgi:hypothetical protein